MLHLSLFSSNVDAMLDEFKEKVISELNKVASLCRSLFKRHKINTNMLHGGRTQYLQQCFIRVRSEASAIHSAL